ncbi:cutinase-2 [Sodiomyces alkalinus F11]|uniref:Cutinase n=1 Tax=Sodiomyces alkalinus (strain CBS 110278 / VKM F-3762 / F11) TaxID=1314773 RepID=A0A3N2Q305_SODAK|nr:cutinase-2 [Sodiomyces alkalinus F11]ROT41149.1 cutinase-2 [Sodiomyces alkalinus F11]
MFLTTKSLLTLTLAALAAASPIDAVEKRQLRNRVRTTATEFTDGGCRPIIMLFARGSTEIGNMGTVCGPPTANSLKANFGAENVAVEGIEYAAALSTNALPGGADPRGVREMERLIARANAECPDSLLVVGGYSQGAAVTHRAVESLPQAQKDQIAAAFTFGDTRNRQDRGQIPNFPPEKTNIICNTGDAVCSGTLVITPAHFAYGSRVDEQVAFITSRLRAAGAKLK